MMPDLDILVSSPFPIDSHQGNSVSARRIANRISDLGMKTKATHGYAGENASILIALHARRSFESAQEFRQLHPQRKTIVVLTGTDLYNDLPNGDPSVVQAMSEADALVTYQETSIADVPEKFRHKVRAIWKSVELPEPPAAPTPDSTSALFAVLAHLRETKAPFLPAAALADLDASLQIRIDHFGRELEPRLADTAAEWMSREPRYRYRGELAREQIAAVIRSSHATINSGRTEGGSNSICESIVLGVPVLATETPANIGFLGDHYEGFYPVDDHHSLAELIRSCSEPQTGKLERLKLQVEERAPLFQPATETAGWRDLIATL